MWLAQQGISSINVHGGTEAWQRQGYPIETTQPAERIPLNHAEAPDHHHRTPDLGDRSYVVGLGSTAVVVDPQRDIDRVYAVLAEHPDWTVTHVIETHAQRLRLRRPGAG